MRIQAHTLSLLFALYLLVACSAYAQAPFPHQKVHFYNGDFRVDLVVSLDELSVSPLPGRAVDFSALSRVAFLNAVQTDARGNAIVSLSIPAVDVGQLNLYRAALGARGYRSRAVFYAPSTKVRDESVRQIANYELSIGLRTTDELEAVLDAYDLSVVRSVEFMPNTFVVRCNSGGLLVSLDTANALYESGLAVFATPLVARWREPRLVPNDTLFTSQWHLRNTAQHMGAVAGNDANIVSAWDTVSGAGVNIAVTDTGVEVAHGDLAANARTDIDIDINDNDLDPSPVFESHGTSVAGIAAAVGGNSLGVTGAAFDAGIVGIRLIEAATTDADEAAAMGHQVSPASVNDRVHINTNSWGPIDDGERLETMGPLTLGAIENGITNGRGGKGTIYTWAAGNGRQDGDNVNYDGYASSRYTIAVGATGSDGLFSLYSEPGASMLVNAPSSDSFAGTTTTTTGGGYTSSFGGTSSSAPLVAGVVALMLEANSGLGWRDVQHVLVDTSMKNDPVSSTWATNGAGRDFSHQYGFGRVDASAAVVSAGNWTNVPVQATPLTNSENPDIVIPDNNVTGVTRGLSIAAPANFVTEHVEVLLDVSHGFRGDLKIVLTAPTGTQSVLSEPHFDAGDDYANWTFTSVAHWGEDPNGTWNLTVSDLFVGSSGLLNVWSVTVYGYVQDLTHVWTDFNHSGFETGEAARPFDTLSESLGIVSVSGTVHIRAGSAAMATTIDQAVTLRAEGGSVRLGN